ncbi:YhgE/Pip domain-containing protein [Lactococcus lactis]|uniref:YhgE/Pip domain-containing protein n=1 Tax=Lactococcus lactis TaxID=1358 RepID=UPI000513F408|nr:YhgE/Pip domain-containing protein [Lactococcus lactis]KGF77809.1 hypothetical protein Llab_0157 [Lactococcus lactis]
MNMIKNEWKNLFKNKILMISVIAISFIPIIYASVFDKSLWDPFGSTKNLPVAVVNQDSSVKIMGQNLNVGDQVVDNLKTNKDIKWKFMSQKEAEDGLKNMKYYSIVTIPKDFSKSAASIIKNDPKKMEINYTTNDSFNYLAGEISEVAATELEIQVRNQVVKSYAKALDQVATEMVGALGKASSGSAQLATGTNQFLSGLGQYTNGVQQAYSGSGQLVGGLGQLEQGIGPLSSGINQLDNGSKVLSSSLTAIQSSISPVQSHLNQIDTGLNEVSKSSKDLASALQNFENTLNPETQKTLSTQIDNTKKQLQELVSNTAELQHISLDASAVESQTSEISDKISNLSTDLSKTNTSINEQIKEAIASNQELSQASKDSLSVQLTQLVDNNLKNVQSTLDNKVSDVKNNLTALYNSSLSLSKGIGEIGQITQAMSNNTQVMTQAISQAESGIQQIQDATGKVPTSESAQGIVNQLNQLSSFLGNAALDIPKGIDGINQLSSGSVQLTTGLDQLKNKIPTLSNGVTKLGDGAVQLNSGLNELDQKNTALMDGISKLQNGAQELAEGLESGINKSKTVKITDKQINHFVNPTSLKHKQYSKVKNYGEALAPYIMSLALFVGCMLFNFIYPIRKISHKGQSSKSWWLSKISIGLGVATIMALIQATVMILIGLPVYSIGLFYFTALASAWCYMSIIMFLAMTFDNPGRFMAMILLVLQLGGAGGTFPIQVQGQFYQIIHPYLPMSYSLYAFRNAIASGISYKLVMQSYSILLGLAVLFILLLRWSMKILQKNYKGDVSALNDNQKLLALETTTREDLDTQIQKNKDEQSKNKKKEKK